MKILNDLIRLLENAVPADPNSVINRRFAKMYEKELVKYFNGLSLAFPYSRLTGFYNTHMEESLESESEAFLAPFLKATSEALKGIATTNTLKIYLSGTAEMITWGKTKRGFPIAFEGPPYAEAVAYTKKRAAYLVTKMNQTTQKRLSRIIADGIKTKKGIPGISRAIRTEFTDMTKYRASLIARTETRNALFQANQDNMEAMGIEGKSWVLGAGGVEGNCEKCIANSSVGVIPVKDEFPNPQDTIHPGCVLPGTMVSPLGMQLMTRAHYSGMVVELHTRRGDRLTVTPNHPILTPTGFIPAERLREGSNVVCSSFREGMLYSMNPDYQQVPSRIEDIWDSLMLSPGMALTSVKVSPVDFHGDAGRFDGDVNIIYPDSLLEGYIDDSTGSKHIRKKQLRGGDTDLLHFPGVSLLNTFSDRAFTPSGSSVGVCRDSLPFNRGEPVHSNQGGLAVSTRRDTSLNQVALDDASVNAELARQFQDRFASFITADEIVEVRNYYFSDHVFNLQSLESLYIANGVVVKNCTCAIAPGRLPGKPLFN